jgi:exopolysaccharide biosynthesis polyprenyl glycosylphosphotransferase
VQEAVAEDRSRSDSALTLLPSAAPREVGLDEELLTGGARRRDTLYRRALATADVFAGAAALSLAVSLRGDGGLKIAAIVFLPVLVFVVKATGLYDRDEHLLRKTTLDEAPKVFGVATLCALLVSLAEDLVVGGGFSGVALLAFWLFLFVFLLTGRVAARRLARSSAVEERCLIVGDGEGTAWARRKLETSPAVKAQLVGCVPLSGSHERDRRLESLGELDSLGLLVEEHAISRVIIAPGHIESNETLDVIRYVKALGVKVSVLPRLFEVVGSSVEFDDVDGMMLLGVRRYGLTASSQVLKRGMDIAGAAALLALLAPLLAIIAVLVRATSPGPALFRQRRMGRHDRPFEMLKFRTMFDGADERKDDLRADNEASGGLFKIVDDPRVTSVGRVLRRSSLDELPQLINVLRGEMSLVGPRPLVVDEDRQVEGWQRHRLLLTPGMTGMWQVFGSSRIPLEEMVKIDYLYGANWSLWSDVKILLRTVPYVVGRRGM